MHGPTRSRNTTVRASAAAPSVVATTGVCHSCCLPSVARSNFCQNTVSIKARATQALWHGRPLPASALFSGEQHPRRVAAWQRRGRSGQGIPAQEVKPVAPFDLGSALGFEAFLAVVVVLVSAAQEWWVVPGIHALAASA